MTKLIMANGKPDEPAEQAREHKESGVDGGAAAEVQRADIPTVPDDALIIIPIHKVVLFPGLVVPLVLGQERSVLAAQEAVRAERQIGVVLRKEADAARQAGEGGAFHLTGTVASILRYVTMQDGSHHIICQGEQRFRIRELLDGFPFTVARVEHLDEPQATSPEIEALMIQLRARTAEVFQLLPQTPAELVAAAQGITTAGALADFVAGVLDLKITEKQDILETVDLRSRLGKVLAFLVHLVEVLRISHDIDQQTKERFEDRQREMLLREQLKTIQKQLGEAEGNAAEISDLNEKITKAEMPAEAETQARKELKRLEGMSDASAEYSMLRTYLDWLIELPWSIVTEDRIDIAEARQILDHDHYGLQKIKRRILEYLAVHKLNPTGKSPILCFVGPPGVGKTSLGQSVAKAMGRKFVRLSLGGVHDEAEIRGHRRTYIGALPGNVIQAIHKAGSRNCVMMLDEIDKLGMSAQGDPSSALLEVLDPEQNSSFRDNYLAVPFDLSAVLFICTANMLDTIPGPLRDRMEVILLSGYTAEEKTQIALRYLVKRQLAANGLSSEQCEISDEAIRLIIHSYTREAGVRNLEREIGSIFRHVAMGIAEGSVEHARIDTPDVAAILGPEKFESELALRTDLPGIATGLAWTPVGGEILFIEANRSPGNGKLILTGQLGDVMKESAQAALTLVKARSGEFGVDANWFEKGDIHVHVPAGATPKDGPSAGVVMFVALASLANNTPVHGDHAMTGEISLRGLVMPIGGVKEKVLAALQAGIKTVMLPARNKRDLEDIPEQAREQLQFVWLETVEDALREALQAKQSNA